MTQDITTDQEIVVEGQFTCRDEIYRKIALYAQDEDRNVRDRYTLTAPKLTVRSENTRIQGGTFVGDVYVQADKFNVSYRWTDSAVTCFTIIESCLTLFIECGINDIINVRQPEINIQNYKYESRLQQFESCDFSMYSFFACAWVIEPGPQISDGIPALLYLPASVPKGTVVGSWGVCPLALIIE